MLEMNRYHGRVAGIAILLAAALTFATHSVSAQVDSTFATPGASGWSPFTAVEQQQLALTDNQLLQLREIDAKLEGQYKALGIEPWTNTAFAPLNRERNALIRGVLTEQQYDQWVRTLGPVPKVPPTIMPPDTTD